MSLVNEILAVSSGTLASISGHRSEEAIDQIAAAWVEFEQASPTPEGQTWVGAWYRFHASDSFAEVNERLLHEAAEEYRATRLPDGVHEYTDERGYTVRYREYYPSGN